jgi:hypothetical protein
MGDVNGGVKRGEDGGEFRTHAVRSGQVKSSQGKRYQVVRGFRDARARSCERGGAHVGGVSMKKLSCCQERAMDEQAPSHPVAPHPHTP